MYFDLTRIAWFIVYCFHNISKMQGFLPTKLCFKVLNESLWVFCTFCWCKILRPQRGHRGRYLTSKKAIFPLLFHIHFYIKELPDGEFLRLLGFFGSFRKELETFRHTHEWSGKKEGRSSWDTSDTYVYFVYIP